MGSRTRHVRSFNECRITVGRYACRCWLAYILRSLIFPDALAPSGMVLGTKQVGCRWVLRVVFAFQHGGPGESVHMPSAAGHRVSGRQDNQSGEQRHLGHGGGVHRAVHLGTVVGRGALPRVRDEQLCYCC